MIDTSIFFNDSLDSLLMKSSLSSLNSISKLNALNNFSSLSKSNNLKSINGSQSYSQILKAMKKKVDDAKTQEELSALESKYEEAMAPIRMFDLYHDIYINNGFFGRVTQSQQRKAKYNVWNNIFSLQAERVNAEAQIALKSALNQAAQKLK